MYLRRSLRLLVPLLALMLAASLVLSGCGGGQKAPEKKTVKIAFLGPLTGPNAMQGVGARNAFELAINQANAAGQLPFKVEMMALDDASTPATAASAAQKAVADPAVVAASGHWNSPCAEATIPIFKSAKMPFIIWGAISPTLTTKENYPYVTRVAPTSAQENIPLGAFVLDKLGKKKWAIISDTSVYGKDNTAAWKAEIAKRPGAEVISLDEIQVGTTDFRPILSKIKGLKPDGIYYGGVVMEAALVKRQMTELKMDDILMCGISGMVAEKLIEVATPQASEGLVAVKPGKAIEDLPGGNEFKAAYEKAGYKEPFGAYGPYAYDAANIILAALKKVGPDKAALVDAIAKINYSGLLGTTTFGETGQTTNVMATVLVVQDGNWVPYDRSKYATGERKLPGTK